MHIILKVYLLFEIVVDETCIRIFHNQKSRVSRLAHCIKDTTAKKMCKIIISCFIQLLINLKATILIKKKTYFSSFHAK